MEKEMVSDSQGALADKNIWYTTKDPDFVEISLRSLVRPSWLDYRPVLQGRYSSSVLKPLSNYVENIGTEPSIVSIIGNTVRFRFYLYADIYLLGENDSFYNVDRTWMRQYYLTDKHLNDPDNQCFDGTFKFFVPWFIEDNLEVRYEQCSDVESPVLVEATNDFWHKPVINSESISRPMFLSPHFVSFKFKKYGSHMEDDIFGIPRRGAPIFDMVASVSDIMLKRIKEQYAYN